MAAEGAGGAGRLGKDVVEVRGMAATVEEQAAAGARDSVAEVGVAMVALAVPETAGLATAAEAAAGLATATGGAGDSVAEVGVAMVALAVPETAGLATAAEAVAVAGKAKAGLADEGLVVPLVALGMAEEVKEEGEAMGTEGLAALAVEMAAVRMYLHTAA